ncbi:MAG: sulfotransferase [Pirellula sp.]
MKERLREAILAFKSGHFPTAEQLCRRLLATDPFNPDALNLMGILAGMADKHNDAAIWIQRAVEVAPSVSEFRKNLARALAHLEKFDEALESIRPLLEVANPSADLLAMKGAMLGQKRDFSSGIAALREAIRLCPNVPTYYFNIAELHRQNAELDEAKESLKKCLDLEPNHADALNNLAGLQIANGDFLDSLQSIQKLLAINPRSAQAYCNLGSLLGAGGDSEAAARAFRNALLLQPNLSRARFQLASMLVRDGHLAEAESIVELLSSQPDMDDTIIKTTHARILEKKGSIDLAWELMQSIDPSKRSQPDVATMLALIQEQRGEKDAAIKTLEASLKSSEYDAIEFIGIYFTLGQLYDSLERYDEAFEAYRLGNENRKKTFRIFENLNQKRVGAVDKVRQLYSQKLFGGCPTSTLDTEAPVFILGMPRSGTTLTEQIISSHSAVHGAGELSKFHDLIRETYGTPSKSQSLFEINLEDPSHGKECLVPDGWDKIRADQLDQLGTKYLDYVRSLNRTASRITDKMPYNYFVVGLISKVFPKSRIIHCVRNPIDTCLSCYFQNFTVGSHYAFDLRELGEFYREYSEIMAHWRDVLNVPMFEVQYEEMVHHPEPVIRSMLSYCGLDWEPQCLRFHKSSRVVSTASYQQVRQPLYTRSAGRWAHYIKHLRPLIESMGLNYEEYCEEAEFALPG